METDPRRQQIHSQLMSHRRGCDNDDTLARMLATQACGGGSMPAGLGLETDEFDRAFDYHFPGTQPPELTSIPTPDWDLRLLEEKDELVKLMLLYRANADESEVWMSKIVAAGCLAADHLWHDLGLWSRRDLSALLQRNFPGLAAKNDRDMKWKKFLYKQLCIQEGIYICRAPSCELCADYHQCFGPEE